MPTSSLVARSQSAVWHPCTQMKLHEQWPPLAVERGAGAWLYDSDGRRYLDAISSWWVNLFGHANPRINAALREQMERIEHVMLAGCTHEAVVELSERLVRLSGLDHVFYASDGASAVEIALKMSFHAWHNAGATKKSRFISVRHGYHGETLGALSVTDVAIFRDVYAPLLRHEMQVESPDWRRARPGETAEDFALRAAADLEACLRDEHEHVAAVIVEPLVQCAAGMAMHHPAWLKRVRALCDQYGVHLIADEIAVGFGRTGTMFACEQAGIVPDLLCLSKGITAGYLPLSAVLASQPVYDAFYVRDVAAAFLHSHSYTGNPLACRAALASLDIFEADDVLAGNRQRAERLDAALAALRDHPQVTHFRRTGMIWAFDIRDAGADFSRRMHQAALMHGILLRPIGSTVYFMPPYVIGEEEIDWLARGTLSALEEALRDVAVP